MFRCEGLFLALISVVWGGIRRCCSWCDYLVLDGDDAGAEGGDCGKGGFGEVNDAAGAVGAAVVDFYINGFAVIEIGDADDCAER